MYFALNLSPESDDMVDGEGLLNIDEAGRCWLGGYIPSLSPGICPSCHAGVYNYRSVLESLTLCILVI